MKRKKVNDNKSEIKKLTRKAVEKISRFNESQPHKVLGPHKLKFNQTVVINSYLPNALEAWIKLKGSNKKIEMKRLNVEGIFQSILEGNINIIKYKIIYLNDNDELIEIYDPYSFPVQITDLDLHLLGEGNHYKSYEKLGSKIHFANKIKGVQFAYWSPNACSVGVTGEFNDWNPGAHPLTNINDSGYWALFIPELNDGEVYKFAVKSDSGKVLLKSDPYAFQSELRPNNASVINSMRKYKWNDKDWMNKRKKSTVSNSLYQRNPISIYEVHPGSWKKCFEKSEFSNEWGYKNYKELAHELVEYVKKMNYTHIELMPMMEHPLDISWGYQVVNYFSPTSRYGNPGEFMYFVDYCHQNNVGVILDWVPSHFPTDVHGLAEAEGKQIYAYENLMKGFHKDWGTFVFDYGRNEVRNFLISNALFWFEKYHVDGLRVDAVASMLYLDYSRKEGEWQPNIYGGKENLEAVEFLKKLNEMVHKKHKGVLMIAEESTSWPGVTLPVHLGGLGFDLKWNMGWMHDILAYFSMDPVYRKFHHGKLTFAIWYAFNEKFLLPLSHDEVVHLKKSLIEKMPGDLWQKFANLRLLFGFMFSHPGKKLNFMTNDIAQYSEWNSESALDWYVMDYEYNQKLNLFFKELNRLYTGEPALYEVDFDSNGFQWIDFSDSDNSVIAFVRYNLDKSEMLLFTFNMTPVMRENYVFGVPQEGFYKEILNSDAKEYGGSGIGNFGGVKSRRVSRFEFPDSITVTLPPLAVNVYKLESKSEFTELKEFSDLGRLELTSESKDIETISDKASGDVKESMELEEFSDLENEKVSIQQIDDNIVGDTELFSDELEHEVKEEVKDPSAEGDNKEDKISDTKKIEISDDDMEDKIKQIINKIKKF